MDLLSHTKKLHRRNKVLNRTSITENIPDIFLDRSTGRYTKSSSKLNTSSKSIKSSSTSINRINSSSNKTSRKKSNNLGLIHSFNLQYLETPQENIGNFDNQLEHENSPILLSKSKSMHTQMDKTLEIVTDSPHQENCKNLPGSDVFRKRKTKSGGDKCPQFYCLHNVNLTNCKHIDCSRKRNLSSIGSRANLQSTCSKDSVTTNFGYESQAVCNEYTGLEMTSKNYLGVEDDTYSNQASFQSCPNLLTNMLSSVQSESVLELNLENISSHQADEATPSSMTTSKTPKSPGLHKIDNDWFKTNVKNQLGIAQKSTDLYSPNSLYVNPSPRDSLPGLGLSTLRQNQGSKRRESSLIEKKLKYLKLGSEKSQNSEIEMIRKVDSNVESKSDISSKKALPKTFLFGPNADKSPQTRAESAAPSGFTNSNSSFDQKGNNQVLDTYFCVDLFYFFFRPSGWKFTITIVGIAGLEKINLLI